MLHPSNTSLPSASTVAELLRFRATATPNVTAYTFLHDGGEAERVTYGQLDKRARAIADRLRHDGISGRVLLLYPAGVEFVAALFGCLYADVVAVPLFPPRRHRSDQRIAAIVNDCQATAALTTAELLGDVDLRLTHQPELAAVRWIDTDGLDAGSPPLVDGRSQGASLAYLQYTSGSTSAPKGVMVSHDNLLHTLKDIDAGWHHDASSVMVSWLPLFHDLGLIYGVLQPLYNGFRCYLMDPASFLQRPVRWLEAITQYGGTHSAAPNFAYELCHRRVTQQQKSTLDLSSWQVALNGAEPVRDESLRAFAAAFEPCGFRARSLCPSYGLAECTLKVTTTSKGRDWMAVRVDADALARGHVRDAVESNENTRVLVGCGQSAVGARIAIVDPDSSLECKADEIGEIWISSASVAGGYWQRPEETQEVFAARLADTGEGPFLRTGDLGFVRNGELFITGRIKDVIIIHGLNHYPHDIELTVERCHRALRPGCGAAFTCDVAGVERLAIVQEVERSHVRKIDVDEVVTAIREAVAREHDLTVGVVSLLKPASVPKTSSGKIQRRACRELLLDGKLDALGGWCCPTTGVQEAAPVNPSPQQPTLSAEAVERWIIERLSERLNIPDASFDANEPFLRYGLDSVSGVLLSGELSEWIGRDLPPTVGFDYPSPRALARHVTNGVSRHRMATTANRKPPASCEPIAVIGVDCRFPGAEDANSFWQLLRDGKETSREVPSSRWDPRHAFGAESNGAGRANAGFGHFLDRVDQFDAEFFGISQLEAEVMDPQQRLLLEVAWAALESAGQTNFAGSQTGVFVGISMYDYARLLNNTPFGESAYFASGTALSIAANRISYLLDLQGPSWAVDTACSSSLVAIHNACQSLRQFDCDMALAGGVSLMLTPEVSVALSQSRMLSGDGRCKTFDAAADGYGRGEGCGLIVLKRYSDAVRNGDNILAKILGSAVNQDGRSNGLTAPNGLAQQQVVRRALDDAAISPAAVDYVETHGTGTPLGDPVEINALKSVLSDGRGPGDFCRLGSVKANIGHLEAAAGIAGLIKVILALQHDELPPHLNLKNLNPKIQLAGTPYSIPTERQPWPRSNRPRIAGVNSFGFGGTNAHVVLAEHAPPETQGQPFLPKESDELPARSVELLPLSAKSDVALRESARRFAEYLENNPQVSLADVCHSARVGRTHFDHRLALTASETEQIRTHLAAFATGQYDNAVRHVRRRGHARPQLGFLFTGQGAAYGQMGRQLYDHEPTFRKSIETCDDILRRELGICISDLMFAPGDRGESANNTRWAQLSLFCLQYSLANLFASWGLVADVLFGHSVGEFAAACVADVMRFEDALRLVARRGQLMGQLPSGGAMVAVFAPAERVVEAANGEASLSIAAYNGSHTVLSGPQQRVRAAVQKLCARGVRCQELDTSHAFHSASIEPALDGLEAFASQFSFRPPRIPLVSSLTGELLADRQAPDGSYWRRHARQPVQFERGVRTLAQMECRVLLEIGPHPVLTGMVASCWPREEPPVLIASLRRGADELHQLCEAVAELYVNGLTPNFDAWDRGRHAKKIVLPTYPFQRRRYWVQGDGHDARRNRSPVVRADSETLQLLAQGKVNVLHQRLRQVGAFEEPDAAVATRILSSLSRQHQSELTTRGLRDSLYQVQWQSADPVPLPAALDGQGTWLLLADAGGLARAVADLLEQRGQRCRLVTPEDVDPTSPEAFDNLVGELLAANESLRSVVHLWSLDLPAEPGSQGLQSSNALTLASTLHLAQALSKRRVFAPMHVLTRAAQYVAEGDQVCPAQTPLWGLGRVIALELPELAGKLLDLPSDVDRSHAAAVLSSLLAEDHEDQVALRGATRHVARLSRIASLPSLPHPPLTEGGSYLITGGLGALGLETANWLAEQGARHVVLTGRRAPGEAAGRQIEQIEKKNCEVHVYQADVSDQRDVTQLLSRIEQTAPPLRGVIHAAGVLDDGMLRRQSWPRFERVLAAKVQGAWLLHEKTAHLPLDFFVLYSSATSVLGWPGQSNYAAANAFLDGLAHYRRSMGLAATSVNWGPWAGRGMANDRTVQTRTRALGLNPLDPDAALSALALMLSAGETQATLLDVNWQQAAEADRRFLKPFTAALVGLSDAGDGPVSDSPLLRSLAETPEDQREAFMTAELQSQLQTMLGLATAPDAEVGFFDLGMDSMLVVEFGNRLRRQFDGKLRLSNTTLFDHPTVIDLSRHLVASLSSAVQPTQVDSASDQHQERETVDRAGAAVEDVVDETELDALLAKKIGLYGEY